MGGKIGRKQSVNAGARLDRLPISRLHWRILGLITAGATLDAFDIYLAGGVVAAMLKEGFATTQQSAVFISTTFFGMLIGAGFAGYLGDRMGRRYSYQFNLAVFGVASLAACFAPNITVLTALRFIMGIGMGAELVVAAGTLSSLFLRLIAGAGSQCSASSPTPACCWRPQSALSSFPILAGATCSPSSASAPWSFGSSKKDAGEPAVARSGRPAR